jgi:MoaA/NifB/PqqE/SkfB family radical SAM enzyme
MLRRLLTLATNKIYSLPVMVLMPHSRCNCRCVMCDIWKSNNDKKEISTDVLQQHIQTFKKLGVKRVALSGGEALMHANLWNFCDQLHGIGVKISLLSTGILLAPHAHEVTTHCDDVIVSLDGSRGVHNAIRNIPSAFEKLEQGVRALKQIDKNFPVTGRCVLQKLNFRDFPNVIRTAKQLGLDQISFLSADVSSTAFNHVEGWQEEKAGGIALTPDETDEFEIIVKQSFVEFKEEYRRRFIAESRDKIGSLVQYYRAIQGKASFPTHRCNAPWVSAVLESNGDVMPCFFHKPYGNIFNGSFEEIINSEEAVSFRKKLNVTKNEICKKCVCSLYV